VGKDMQLPTEKVPVLKDDKCFMCNLQIVMVKGGKQVIYVADDGSVIKREPLRKCKNRIKRRKRGSEHDAPKDRERCLQ
jgi:hypothetical protein